MKTVAGRSSRRPRIAARRTCRRGESTRHSRRPRQCGLPDIVKSFKAGREISVRAGGKSFQATVRIDTPQEALYYQHGGILQYVLRQLLGQK
jgi:hypothetical protein